jgi:hypothetical protein
MSCQEIYDTRLAHSRSSGECQSWPSGVLVHTGAEKRANRARQVGRANEPAQARHPR